MRKRVASFALVLAWLLSFIPTAFAAESWLWPADGCLIVSSNFGMRDLNGDGKYSSDEYHHGIDIRGSSGTSGKPVRAAKSGTVYQGENTIQDNTFIKNSMGNYTMIDHGDGTYSVYMHMKPGNKTSGIVKRGDVIGYIGNTGTSYGAHLHFEIYTNRNNRKNSNLNPMPTNSNIKIRNVYILPSGWAMERTTYVFDVAADTTPGIPNEPSVSTAGDRVTVAWNDVSYETGYDVFLVQAPWGTEDIKYSASVGADVTSCTFYGVADGGYAAFVIARPSPGFEKASSWTDFTVKQEQAMIIPSKPDIQLYGTNFIEGDTVTVIWSPVDNAEKYAYYVSEFPQGYAYVNSVRSGETTATSVSFSDLPSGAYTIFVQACSSTGTWSAQSQWLVFDVRKSDYVATKVLIWNDHLYALYDAQEAWDHAKELCEKIGGHLATITSAEEDSIIAELLQSTKGDGYWIGGHDDVYNDTPNPYTWVTGEPFAYTNWYPGEPNGAGYQGTKEHYLEYRKSYGNRWNDLPNRTSSNDGFILEIDDISYIHPTYTERWGTSEYRVYDMTMTWNDAKAFCEHLGGHLATAESSAEYEAIAQMMEKGERSWYYLGGVRTSEKGDGVWLSGSTISKSDSKILWSEFNQGNYLFAYRYGAGLGWMKSAYHPIDDQICLGFVCEIENVVPAHRLTYVPEKTATCLEPGSRAHWICADCGMLFDDETGATQLSRSQIELAAMGHSYVDGICIRCGKNDPDYVSEIHFLRRNVYHQGQFTDVLANQWYTPYVAFAFELGLVKGNSETTYNPYGNVTVAEAITMAARIHSIYTTGMENFVQTGKWYQVFVDYAYQNGIINYAYYNSDVTQTITRAQFAEVFANALPDKGLTPVNHVADTSIPDVKMTASYAPSVYKLYRAGILAGNDRLGTFAPDTFITRAEAATILARMADTDYRVAFTMD